MTRDCLRCADALPTNERSLKVGKCLPIHGAGFSRAVAESCLVALIIRSQFPIESIVTGPISPDACNGELAL